MATESKVKGKSDRVGPLEALEAGGIGGLVALAAIFLTFTRSVPVHGPSLVIGR
jgi:hypothetical protein